MKKSILWLIKACLSGLLAFALLTAFCTLYYNLPVHDTAKDGATDYAWEYNTFYARGTEGFALGRTNNEGYINTFDYTGQAIDVLIMGSSHMEAYQVAMDETTASVLGALLPESTVYNIGVSDHNFMVCADNLSAAVAKYKPTGYVVIETSDLLFTDKQLTAAIDEKVSERASKTDGLLGLLQRNPFFRLLNTQLHDYRSNANAANTTTLKRGSEERYDALLEKLSRTVSENGAELILVYHPHMCVNDDGTASPLLDEELTAFFSDVCQKNNVTFLNMADTFTRRYAEDHLLPHGFTNSSVASGHLNRYGHEMIAKALYTQITEEE